MGEQLSPLPYLVDSTAVTRRRERVLRCDSQLAHVTMLAAAAITKEQITRSSDLLPQSMAKGVYETRGRE
ncbi:unnamed protein product [Thelazia callipaeda]|uniref:2-phosphosulfolactate phosphatase n=1 Tax=Thelazia callipaeda TaxID=103827 RepID=A0A0N5D231_THECL|nr:unnamed protein product [Thelazia callipaeda]